MFGYVNVCQDELKIKDYKLFRAHYCGLCKALGKRGSNAARLGLSYDMNFLALVLSAIDADKLRIRKSGCMMHPFHKHDEVYESIAVDYAADMSVILTYLKCLDDWQDDKSIKALGGMAAYKSAVRRVKKHCGGEYEKILGYLKQLGSLEKANCGELDEAADCFANILKIIFVPAYIKEENMRRALEWLGYNTGRWIYIIDAFNDIEKDAVSGSYNPFIVRYGITEENAKKVKEQIAESTGIMMDCTLSNIASAYELLGVKRNKAILENIIYIGLRNKQDLILKVSEEKNTDESV